MTHKGKAAFRNFKAQKIQVFMPQAKLLQETSHGIQIIHKLSPAHSMDSLIVMSIDRENNYQQ